jgi:hypothetical protein
MKDANWAAGVSRVDNFADASARVNPEAEELA